MSQRRRSPDNRRNPGAASAVRKTASTHVLSYPSQAPRDHSPAGIKHAVSSEGLRAVPTVGSSPPSTPRRAAWRLDIQSESIDESSVSEETSPGVAGFETARTAARTLANGHTAHTRQSRASPSAHRRARGTDPRPSTPDATVVDSPKRLSPLRSPIFPVQNKPTPFFTSLTSGAGSTAPATAKPALSDQSAPKPTRIPSASESRSLMDDEVIIGETSL